MNKKILLGIVLMGAMIMVPMAQSAYAVTTIPDWIKVVAGSWAEGDTSDEEFVEAIEYLIGTEIIHVTPVANAESLTIGFIPVEKAEELTPKAEALQEYLEDALGIPVEISIPTNYEAIIEGLRFGHIDAAFMDTGPGWIAHQLSGAEVVMAEVKSNGEIAYQATVWVRADNTDINSIEDTLGKKVAFTSQTGSSGFVRPFGSLVANGHVDVNGDDVIALNEAVTSAFEAHTFAGGYSAALALLVSGEVDVAFGSDIAPQLYLTPEEQGIIKAATTLGPVPSHVVVVSDTMSTNTQNALVNALIGLNYDAHNDILRDLYGAQALLPTTTTLHIGSFGDYLDVLPGLSQAILDKKDFR